jgi:hypothetical protein
MHRLTTYSVNPGIQQILIQTMNSRMYDSAGADLLSISVQIIAITSSKTKNGSLSSRFSQFNLLRLLHPAHPFIHKFIHFL